MVKNKVAPPFRVVEFDIMYGEGISKPGELIDLGVKAGVVEKSGSWFSYNSQRIGQGRENAKQFLKEQPGHRRRRSRRTIRGKAAVASGAGRPQPARSGLRAKRRPPLGPQRRGLGAVRGSRPVAADGRRASASAVNLSSGTARKQTAEMRLGRLVGPDG